MEDLQIISPDSVREIRVIGQGAYGKVTQGYHVNLGMIAIKKVLSPKPKQLKKLKEEARKLSQLLHPHIVRFHGFIEEPEQCAIVLEFCKYGSLHDLIESYDCPTAVKVQFMYEVADGMVHLHNQTPPVIHRDLKAANVLIGENLRAKLADFGLSEWKTVMRSQSVEIPRGTVTHIPPEKWADINYPMERKCDVYSYGILTWEVFMETAPFNDANEKQIQVAVKEGQRPSMKQFPEEMPQVLKQLIEKCWSHNPEERPYFPEIKQQMGDFVNEESYRAKIEEEKQQLSRDIQENSRSEYSLPTNVVVSKNHSNRPLEQYAPQQSHNSEDYDKVISNAPDSFELQSPSDTATNRTDIRSPSLSENGQIPTVVSPSNNFSPIHQKVYNIVNQQLENNVETDSVPINDSKSKSSPSGHYTRVPSIPNKEVPMSDLPPTKQVNGKSSKLRSSRPKGATTIISKGAGGETVIHTSKVDGIQIGDRNVMYVGSGGSAMGIRNSRSSNQPPKIRQGKLVFDKKPLDEDSTELLSQHLGKHWRNLGRKLGFTDGQLDSIDADYYKEGHSEVIHQMLRQWREREGRSATVDRVGNALVDIGLYGKATLLRANLPSKNAKY